MKKRILICVLIIFTGFIFYINKKQVLPIPDYPLDIDTITSTLLDYGFDCTLKEYDYYIPIPVDNLEYLTRGFNVLNNKGNHFFGTIASRKIEHERVLEMFFPSTIGSSAIPYEESEDYIVFSTVLFGGFKNSHQVYNEFLSEYGKVSTPEEPYNTDDKISSTWSKKIGKTTCKITLIKAGLKESQEYLSSITFFNESELYKISPKLELIYQ